MRKVAGEHPFCVLIYMNSYIFHICFIVFILCSYLIFGFVCLTLSLADTHGIAKYARTNKRDIHTHAHTHKKKVERLEKKVEKIQTKKRGVRKERKKKKRKDDKKRWEKKEENERKRRGEGKNKQTKKRKREGDGFRGVEKRGY